MRRAVIRLPWARYVDVNENACLQHTSPVTGKTKTLSNPRQENLDVDVLTGDLVNLIRTIFPDVETAPSLLVSECDFDGFPAPLTPCSSSATVWGALCACAHPRFSSSINTASRACA